MKIFISWSGTISQRVAMNLREWLPLVVPGVKPYVSGEDIEKGARWATDIGSELEASAYGVLCVTEHNQNAPWILFEAGALSKKLESSRVSPLVIGMRPAQLDRNSPLLQFQATEFTRQDVWKLVQSINRSAGVQQDTAILEKQFTAWWPQLEKDIKTAVDELSSEEHSVGRPAGTRAEEMLEELLALAREQQRRTASARSDERPMTPQSILQDIQQMCTRIEQSVDDLDECQVQAARLQYYLRRASQIEADYLQFLDPSAHGLIARATEYAKKYKYYPPSSGESV